MLCKKVVEKSGYAVHQNRIECKTETKVETVIMLYIQNIKA